MVEKNLPAEQEELNSEIVTELIRKIIGQMMWAKITTG